MLDPSVFSDFVSDTRKSIQSSLTVTDCLCSVICCSGDAWEKWRKVEPCKKIDTCISFFYNTTLFLFIFAYGLYLFIGLVKDRSGPPKLKEGVEIWDNRLPQLIFCAEIPHWPNGTEVNVYHFLVRETGGIYFGANGTDLVSVEIDGEYEFRGEWKKSKFICKIFNYDYTDRYQGSNKPLEMEWEEQVDIDYDDTLPIYFFCRDNRTDPLELSYPEFQNSEKFLIADSNAAYYYFIQFIKRKRITGVNIFTSSTDEYSEFHFDDSNEYVGARGYYDFTNDTDQMRYKRGVLGLSFYESVIVYEEYYDSSLIIMLSTLGGLFYSLNIGLKVILCMKDMFNTTCMRCIQQLLRAGGYCCCFLKKKKKIENDKEKKNKVDSSDSENEVLGKTVHEEEENGTRKSYVSINNNDRIIERRRRRRDMKDDGESYTQIDISDDDEENESVRKRKSLVGLILSTFRKKKETDPRTKNKKSVRFTQQHEEIKFI